MTFAPKGAPPPLALSEGAAIPHEKGGSPPPPERNAVKTIFFVGRDG